MCLSYPVERILKVFGLNLQLLCLMVSTPEGHIIDLGRQWVDSGWTANAIASCILRRE